VVGIEEAMHEESAPNASNPVISKLRCSLVGTTQHVGIVAGSRVHQAYQAETAIEKFRCSYGLNPAYRDQVLRGGIRVAGADSDKEIRAIELPHHPFFVAALFLPQLSSNPNTPHPLIVAYLRAALQLTLGIQ
jgi:CTP synthase (UTP-ammonia lyase)